MLFLLGLFIGSFAGVLTACLCVASGNNERDLDESEDE